MKEKKGEGLCRIKGHKLVSAEFWVVQAADRGIRGVLGEAVCFTVSNQGVVRLVHSEGAFREGCRGFFQCRWGEGGPQQRDKGSLG